MSDTVSKADKLAEGKKKLKKFQSKNKAKGAVDVSSVQEPFAPEYDSHSATTDNGSVTATDSNLYPISATGLSQDSTAVSVTSSVGQVDPVTMMDVLSSNPQSLQAQTMENYKDLSRRFDDLEQELGRSLSNTPSNDSRCSAQAAIGINTEILETQVHELTRKLNEERQTNQSLELRLREQYSNVDQLTLKLQSLEVGRVSQVQTELGPLKDQLDNQIRTVALLVGEKAELCALLTNAESQAQSKRLENEELHAKLGASRHQVQTLKEELANLKKSTDRFDSTQQSLCTEMETARDDLRATRKANEDLKEEVLELRRTLELKEINLNSLMASHTEKLQEIEGLRLRLTQLMGSDEDPLQRDRVLEANAQQRFALEAQIQELLSQVEKANVDRDNAASHYQNYVQQLNKEREGWVLKVQEVTKERDELSKRGQDLVQHLSELEKQLQQQRAIQSKVTQESSAVSSPEPSSSGDPELHNKQLQELQESLEAKDRELKTLSEKLTEEKERAVALQSEAKAREEQLMALESEAERLRSSHVDPQQISAQLESEKVAASRAMAQNQELRTQLEEMQSAFVQMTNDKACLMTELESERYLSREIRSRHGEWDEELKALKEKLHFKDEEMIRLTHEGTEQTKKILVLQQELEQLRKLEVGERDQGHLHMVEIHRQRQEIERLKGLLRNGVDEKDSTVSVSPLDVSVAEEVQERRIQSDTDDAVDEPQVSAVETVAVTALSPAEEIIPESVYVQEIATAEAMVKLQERFTRTMSEIAELSDEKQRLEHLVIQLQGETETIGEYIALYQNQRKLLKQREMEKDIQVQKITADREEMKEKLSKLNSLVEQMLVQRNIPVVVQENGNCNGIDTAMETTGSGGVLAELSPGAVVNAQEKPQSAIAGNPRETAEQILDLLTEIKTQNTNFLTDPLPTPCSCCSGQLITV